MDSLSGQDCVFVLDQWRSYAFQLGRHYLSDDGRCDLCYKAIGRGDGLARDVAGVTRGLKAGTITQKSAKILTMHLRNHAGHLKLDWPGIREDHESGWLTDDEYEKAMAVVPKLESLLDKMESTQEENHALGASTVSNIGASPETNDGAVKTVSLAGHDVPKDYLDRYVSSIEVLQRVSKISKTRPNPGMVAKALGNRTELHKAIFGFCGLDHDSVAEAETDMRTAIDKYAEKDLAGKPGWEDFDLLTRH